MYEKKRYGAIPIYRDFSVAIPFCAKISQLCINTYLRWVE